MGLFFITNFRGGKWMFSVVYKN